MSQTTGEIAVIADAEVMPPSDLLEMLDVAAEQYVNEQQPKNTRLAHEADWRAWTAYTATLGIPDTSASVGALVGFVAHLERAGLAPSTIDRRLSGAVVGLRARGVEPARQATKEARRALDGYRRRLAEAGQTKGRGAAPALTIRDLRAITAACPDTLSGIRDRALTLLAFAIAGRRSEVASLLVSDVVADDNGLVVTIRFGKTGGRTVAVPYGSHRATCPVRAWRAWLDASGLTEGLAVRRVDRHGRILDGMSGQAVGDVITRVARRAGLAQHFTGHSARSGLATEARRAGHDSKTIATQGGWTTNSSTLGRYMQIVDRWSDNAVAGIGL